MECMLHIYYVYVYIYICITYRHLYQRPAPRDFAYFVGPSIELAWRVVQAAESRKANENRDRCGVFPNFPWLEVHEGVSENRGTPKSSILIGFSIINHPFWGTPIFGNTHEIDSEHSVCFFL